MVRRAQPRQAEQLVPGSQEHHRRRVRQGRRRQEHGQRQPRRRPRPGGRAASACSMRTSPGPNIPHDDGRRGPAQGERQQQDHARSSATASRSISIQFFVPEGQPIVWRGPLVGGAIQQFLRDVEWGDLDYLVIDLPPGTSDAQLTLAQAVPISGTVLVDDAPGGRPRRRQQGARDVPADERAGHRRGREHGRLRLPPLRRGHRDLRPWRRRAVRRQSTASSTSARSRSISPFARAATSACRRSPSASRGRPRRR